MQPNAEGQRARPRPAAAALTRADLFSNSAPAALSRSGICRCIDRDIDPSPPTIRRNKAAGAAIAAAGTATCKPAPLRSGWCLFWNDRLVREQVVVDTSGRISRVTRSGCHGLWKTPSPLSSTGSPPVTTLIRSRPLEIRSSVAWSSAQRRSATAARGLHRHRIAKPLCERRHARCNDPTVFSSARSAAARRNSRVGRPPKRDHGGDN